MSQWGLPNANSGTTNWTQGAGDGDADWFDELAEGFGAGRGSGAGPDDTTTAWISPQSPVNEQIKTALSSVTDPQSSSGHVVRTRNRKSSASGVQIDIIIYLFEGATQRATASFAAVNEVFTTRVINLSAAEADAITNYGNLIVVTEADAVGGGANRRGNESAHELEVPNAPGGGGNPYYAYVNQQ